MAASWPDGRVCQNCYAAAKRTRGTCACGHEGVLPGRIDGEPACRDCSGIRLNVDCVRCGAEDELYRNGECWRCTLGPLVDSALTDPRTGTIPKKLQPLAEGLKTMQRANSGLTWLRQAHVQSFFRGLLDGRTTTITHQTIDALPSGPSREYTRKLLVAHGAIPSRDENKARFLSWVVEAEQRVATSSHAELIRTYIRWEHLRKMNGMDAVPTGTFLRSKQAITVAIDLLNWLTDHGVDFADLTQTHLDDWITTGPTTRQVATRFLSWAKRTSRANRDLHIQPHKRGGAERMAAPDQAAVINSIASPGQLSERDRAIAILILVFGQQLVDIVRLQWSDVLISDDVSVTLGSVAIVLPSPLDEPWRYLAANPANTQTAAHHGTDWVFPGYSPGEHLNASFLRHALARYFSVRAARLGALSELSRLGPIPVIAEALGYSTQTIERHAVDANAAYARYVGALYDGGGAPTL